MTLEAWVNPTSMSGWESVLYKERGIAGSGLLSYALYARDGGTNTPPAGYVRTTAAGRRISGIQGTLPRLPLNIWSHIAVDLHDRGWPGQFVAALLPQRRAGRGPTTAVNQNIVAGTQPLRIGNSNASVSEGFNGLIDEIRIYNRALSAAEISTDMNVPIVQ